MSKVLILSYKMYVVDYYHSYLAFVPDDYSLSSSSDALTISGYPEFFLASFGYQFDKYPPLATDNFSIPLSKIYTFSNVSLSSSPDGAHYSSNLASAVEIPFIGMSSSEHPAGGLDVERAWAAMSLHSFRIGMENITYWFPNPNSNSVIASTLAAVGKDVLNYLPRGLSEKFYPGINDLITQVIPAPLSNIGYSGNDHMVGDAGSGAYHGVGGNDSIDGAAGNDTIFGGSGADIITGGMGNDILYGNQGDDTVYSGGKDQSQTGDDSVFGGKGNDSIVGNFGSDTIHGNANNDYIHGGEGNDIIYGNEDSDTIYGGQGDDTIYGGQGDDLLYIGNGNEVIFGGAGNDTFVLPNRLKNFTFDAGVGDRVFLNGATVQSIKDTGLFLTDSTTLEFLSADGASGSWMRFSNVSPSQISVRDGYVYLSA